MINVSPRMQITHSLFLEGVWTLIHLHTESYIKLRFSLNCSHFQIVNSTMICHYVWIIYRSIIDDQELQSLILQYKGFDAI
jgi:hypothetical protein